MKQLNKYLGKHLFFPFSSQVNFSSTPLPRSLRASWSQFTLFFPCITLNLSLPLQGCGGQCRRLRLECSGFSLPIHAFGSFSSTLMWVFHKPQSLSPSQSLLWVLLFLKSVWAGVSHSLLGIFWLVLIGWDFWSILGCSHPYQSCLQVAVRQLLHMAAWQPCYRNPAQYRLVAPGTPHRHK